MSRFSAEVAQGNRFEFGKNWARFLSTLNEERVARAEDSLRAGLEVQDLQGLTFLDIGSGSGLFSLAARLLGARVHSFDYDPHSVACTRELKSRYFPEDPDWTIEEGSVLDESYLANLGAFDIVYSWGVLHHTGAMWQALANVAPLVAARGKLFLAIYNDQGVRSHAWRFIKQLYNQMPRGTRWTLLSGVYFYSQVRKRLALVIQRRNPFPLGGLNGSSLRGMSAWHDFVDWVGGYPFEVAKPEEVFKFYRRRGFVLLNLRTKGGSLGCNEYVFESQARNPESRVSRLETAAARIPVS